MLLLLVAAILTTALNLCTTFYNVNLLRQLHSPKEKEYTWAGADHPAALQVRLPTVALSFVNGPHFTLHADADWGTIFPTPGQGFIRLGPEKRYFVPSIYHQLHCLDAIRVAYVVNGSFAPEHMEHCLRYLRQAVLCSADTTLEETTLQESKNGTMVPVANEVGMVHRCKDWTVLRTYMEENA